MGFALGIFPILTVSGVFKLRRDNPSALRLAGYPFTQILYLIAGVLILVLSFLERPVESSIATFTVLVWNSAILFLKKENTS